MKTMILGDILEAMKMKYLPKDKELKLKVIGLQKGENLHERLIMNGPLSSEYKRYTVEEIYEII